MKTTLFQLLFILSFTVFANTFGIAQATLNSNPITRDVSEISSTKTKNDSIFNSEKKEAEKDSIYNLSLIHI